MKLKKTLIITLAAAVVIIAVPLIYSVATSKVAVYEVSLKVGETYEITDESELDTTMSTTYETTDKEVATLLSGKYINAKSTGEAIITVDDGKTRSEYKVTVAENEAEDGFTEENRYYAKTFSDAPLADRYISSVYYIGCCYNALENAVCNENTMSSVSLFRTDKLCGSGDLYTSTNQITKVFTYGASTYQTFMNSYSKKTQVSVSVKLFGINVCKSSGEFSSFNLDTRSDTNGMGQIYVENRYCTIFVNADYDECFDFMTDSAKSALLGEDGTSVEDFISKYGTHVLIGGNYGSSFSYSYVLSNSKKSIDSFEGENLAGLKGSAGNINAFFLDAANDYNNYNYTKVNSVWDGYDNAGIDGDSGEFDANLEIMWQDKNEGWCSPESLTNVSLGRAIERYKTWGGELFEYSDNGKKWYNISVLLSPYNTQSLVPVWELIPTDTQENTQRKQEFVNYIKQQTRS